MPIASVVPHAAVCVDVVAVSQCVSQFGRRGGRPRRRLKKTATDDAKSDQRGDDEDGRGDDEGDAVDDEEVEQGDGNVDDDITVLDDGSAIAVSVLVLVAAEILRGLLGSPSEFMDHLSVSGGGSQG